MRKRLKFCLVAPLAALACLALSGPAMAGEDTRFEAGDPLTTNIPYVAYAGSEVRLVKCITGNREGVEAEWQVVDWSGVNPDGQNSRDPVFFDDVDQRTTGRVVPRDAEDDPFNDQGGRICWAIDIESQKPGMAVVKFATDVFDPPAGAPEFKHQFLVIWLKMNRPTITELSNDSLGDPPLNLGDPTGDGNFNPMDCSPAAGWQGCFRDGLVRVTVNGSFPLGQNFSDDLDGDASPNTVTLPQDWELLARTYAVDINGRNPGSWDIHDDQGTLEAHSNGSFCVEGGSPIDAVDNCLGGNEVGPFSRLIGGTDITLGPFDPLRPSTSYLPDGALNAGDAPMPAARVDLALSGTMGGLARADKHVVYSRNRAGSEDNPATPAVEDAHNLYAPFYAALIPPTSFILNGGSLETSGVVGAIANNFPGFQPFPGVVSIYHYWELLNTRSRGGANACRDVGGTGQFGPPASIARPAGVTNATVYTDEHGEAMVRFLPDVGVGLTPDNQGLCDLGEISDTPRLIGSATISAEALDPFQPVFDAPRMSNTLTKNLYSLAGKTLDCIPKSNIEAYCVETVRDIRGNLVENARVSFTREPRGLIEPAKLKIAPYDTTGQTNVSDTDNEVVVLTGRNGQAGIVVKSTLPGLVDIDAENILTRNGGFGVQRVRCIRFSGGATPPVDAATCAELANGGTPTQSAPTNPAPTNPAPSNPAPSNPAPSNQAAPAPAAAAIVSLAGNPVPATAPAAKTPAVKAKLASARFVFVNGKRYLVVRANGAAATAKIRIIVVMRTGKAMKPVVRTISTNKPVRVANLAISKHVRTVRVSIL